jgi:hypothetical protein
MSLPECREGDYCQRVNNLNHCLQYSHPCPHGDNCVNLGIDAHNMIYLHPKKKNGTGSHQENYTNGFNCEKTIHILLDTIKEEAINVNPFLFIKLNDLIDSEIHSVNDFKTHVENQLKSKELKESDLNYLITGIHQMLNSWSNGSFLSKELDQEALQENSSSFPFHQYLDTDDLIKYIVEQFKDKKFKDTFKIRIHRHLKEKFDPDDCLDLFCLISNFLKNAVEKWKGGDDDADLEELIFKLDDNEKLNILKSLQPTKVFPDWSKKLFDLKHYFNKVNYFDGILIK